MAGLQIDLGQGRGMTTSSNPQVVDDGKWVGDVANSLAGPLMGVATGYAQAKVSDALEQTKGQLQMTYNQQQNDVAAKSQELGKVTMAAFAGDKNAEKRMKGLQEEISRIQRGVGANRISAASAEAMIDNKIAEAMSSYPLAKDKIKVLGSQFKNDGVVTSIIEDLKFSKDMAEKSYDEKRKAMMDYNLDINNPTHVAVYESHMNEYSMGKMRLDRMNQQLDMEKAKYGAYQTNGKWAFAEVEKATLMQAPTMAHGTLSQILKSQGTPEQKIAMVEAAKQDHINQIRMQAAKGGADSTDVDRLVKSIEDMYEPMKTEIESGDPLKYQERLLKTAETNRKLGMENNYGSYMIAKDLGLTNLYTDMVDTMNKGMMGSPEDRMKAENLMKVYGLKQEDLANFGTAMDTLIKTGGKSAVINMAGLFYAKNGKPLQAGQGAEATNIAMLAASEPPSDVANAMQSAAALDALSGNTNMASYLTTYTPAQKAEYQKYFKYSVQLLVNKFKDDMTVNVGKNGKLVVVDKEGNETPILEHPMLKGLGNKSLGNMIGQYVDRDIGAAQAEIPMIEKVIANIPEAKTWFGDGISRGELKYEPSKWEILAQGVQGVAGMITNTFGNVTDVTASKLGVNAKYVAPMQKASEFSGVPLQVIAKQIGQESSFDHSAVSPTGVRGLVQMTIKTAKSLGLDPTRMRSSDKADTDYQIMGYSKYMKQLMDQFNGDVTMAVLAYNSGPQAAIDYKKGIKPRSEGVAYVKRILGVDL